MHNMRFAQNGLENYVHDAILTHDVHDAIIKAQGARRSATLSKVRYAEMPITVTFHVFGFTITVTVKKQNRHPAR